jgi:hypothetical protein
LENIVQQKIRVAITMGGMSSERMDANCGIIGYNKPVSLTPSETIPTGEILTLEDQSFERIIDCALKAHSNKKGSL